MRTAAITVTSFFLGQVIGYSFADGDYRIGIFGVLSFAGFVGYIYFVNKDIKKIINGIRK